jgi:hypothetical protein
MVFARQLTGLIGGWHTFTRKRGQALSPRRDAFAQCGPIHPHQLREIGAIALAERFRGSPRPKNTCSRRPTIILGPCSFPPRRFDVLLDIQHRPRIEEPWSYESSFENPAVNRKSSCIEISVTREPPLGPEIRFLAWHNHVFREPVKY